MKCTIEPRHMMRQRLSQRTGFRVYHRQRSVRTVRAASTSLDARLEKTLGLKVIEAKEAYDVIIVGSGPAGSTYARTLVPEGVDVLMVEAGAQGGERPGWHPKNSYKYQKDINSFASHIRSALHTLSVPSDWRTVDNIDPIGFNPLPNQANGFVRGNQNPYQSNIDNLPAAAATYAVGGMATHWTCACPRPHPTMEANWLFPDAESFDVAEKLLRVRQDAFMPYSVRDTVLNQVLKDAYTERNGPSAPLKVTSDLKHLTKYGELPQPLPLGASRNPHNPELVEWTGTDHILGDELIRIDDDTNGQHSIDGYGRFKIMDNTVCKGFSLSRSKDTVDAVYLFDAFKNQLLKVNAKIVVIAAGTVLTPQLVWLGLESDEQGSTAERLPALGKYLTEQPMAFCQVIWRRDVVMDKFVPYCGHDLNIDPIPVPPNDPEPNQWIPVSSGRPWHAQVHRDAFAYGDTAPNIDSRMVVDLRWFGIVGQHAYNSVEFNSCRSRGVEDFLGLPQPTFHYRYNEEERRTMHEMMEDMVYYATKIGSFIPGSEPQFMKPGLTLHIHGTTRVGFNADDSCVSKTSLTHGFTNLYLAGNGNIPKAIACNPTLTNVAYSHQSAKHILKQLGKRGGASIVQPERQLSVPNPMPISSPIVAPAADATDSLVGSGYTGNGTAVEWISS